MKKADIEKLIDTRVAEILRLIAEEQGARYGIYLFASGIDRVAEQLEEKHDPVLAKKRHKERYGH